MADTVATAAAVTGPKVIATDRRAGMLSLKTVTWSLAFTGAVLYLVCIAYGLGNPAGGHMRDLLAIALPGFVWLTPGGFAVGLVKSFLYGALVGLVYVPIHNALEWRSRAGE